jgi:hypothetical protein
LTVPSRMPQSSFRSASAQYGIRHLESIPLHRGRLRGADRTKIRVVCGGPDSAMRRTKALHHCLNGDDGFIGGAGKTHHWHCATSTRRHRPHSRACSRTLSTASHAFSPPLPAPPSRPANHRHHSRWQSIPPPPRNHIMLLSHPHDEPQRR